MRRLTLASLLAVLVSVLFVTAAYLTPHSAERLRLLAVGVPEDFPPGTATHFEAQHFFLVRLDSGQFLAIYDLDPYQQARIGPRRPPGGCRLEWLPPVDAASRGYDSDGGGVFRDPCQGSVYNARGDRIFGPAQGGLDRYSVRITSTVTVDFTRVACASASGPIKRQCPLAKMNY